MDTLKGWSLSHTIQLERAGAVASAFSLLCERFCACVVAITYKHEEAIVGASSGLFMWLLELGR